MQPQVTTSALQRARALRERLLRISEEELPAWIEDALPWPTSPARLSDDTPEANLLEDLLLAHAALGRPLDEIPSEVKGALREIPSPAEHEALRLGHRVTERHEQAWVEPALAVALVRGENIVDKHKNGIQYILNDRTLFDLIPPALNLLRAPLRLLAYHPESLATALTNSPSTRKVFRLLQPPGSLVHLFTASEAELVRSAVSAPLLTDRVNAASALLMYSLNPAEGRRFDRAAEAEARLADLLRSLDTPADECVRFELAALSAGSLGEEPGDTVDLAHIYGAGFAIARALLASPFFGSDPLLLGARLAASVHDARARLTPRLRRRPLPFGAGDGELRPHWPALRAALGDLPRLGAPVLEALRPIARRAATPAERAASATRPSTYGWNTARLTDAVPIEPPMFARWLLHYHRQPWAPLLEDEAATEVVEAVSGEPAESVAWIMAALPQRGRWSPQLEERLVEAFAHREPEATAGAPWLEPWCHWGTTLLERLPEERGEALVRIAATQTQPAYRVGLLKLIVERSPGPTVREAAAEALLGLLTGAERTLRPPAGVALLLLLKANLLDRRWRARVSDGLTAELRRHPNLVDLVRYADPA